MRARGLRWAWLAVGLASGLGGCTDWDAPVRAGIAVTTDPRAVADVDHTGLVYWDTVALAGADAAEAGADGAAVDADGPDGSGADGSGAPGDADATADAEIADTAAGDTAAGDAGTVDTTSGDAASVDSAVDGTGLGDTASGACAGSNKPLGCACAGSQQCASGLCVYGASGPVCSPSCKTDGCPPGWTCTAPAMVCKQDAMDAGAADAVQEDATAEDAQDNDAQASDVSDAQTADLPASDIEPADAGAGDAATSDVQLADLPLTDVPLTDVQLADASAADADASEDMASDADPDGLTGLDWTGYSDAQFPEDADIYGGAINSCLSLYLYQQETCGKEHPTAACIDDVAKQGSLYANYLFEPVRACQDALCVDQCANAADETCMNACIGKNCPNQFLQCVSNAQVGTDDCKTAFSCSMGYPGKLLTIGAKCYANASKEAQWAVGGLISCETKPNTDSCFQAVGDCYDQGAAATASCAQTITCTQTCAGDQTCVWTCLGTANPQARAAIDALGDCLVTVCNPKCNGDQTCQNACLGTDCASQFGACMAN